MGLRFTSVLVPESVSYRQRDYRFLDNDQVVSIKLKFDTGIRLPVCFPKSPCCRLTYRHQTRQNNEEPAVASLRDLTSLEPCC